jgi:type II secretory pathway pseudopilin PulG
MSKEIFLRVRRSGSRSDFVNQSNNLSKSKRSQIWVETAVYTLIGLAIIGIVLAIATPAINRYKDGLTIEQTITVLNDLNEKIRDVEQSGSGNRRVIPELRIQKGKIDIDCPLSKIVYTLADSGLEYSESSESVEVKQGDLIIKTEKKGKTYDITLTLPYEDIILKYKGENVKKTLNPVAAPYQIYVENNGTFEGKTQIILGEI